MRAEAGNGVPPSLARGRGTRRAIEAANGKRPRRWPPTARRAAERGSTTCAEGAQAPRCSTGQKTELRPDRAQRLRRLKVVLK